MTRINQLRKILKKQEVEALLVTHLTNVKYLTGFTGTAGALLVTQEDAIFVTDFRYTQQAKDQTSCVIRENTQNIYYEIRDLLKELRISSVAIEAEKVNVTTFRLMEKIFTSEIIESEGWVEELREIKDAQEIQAITRAVEIIEDTYEHILEFIQIGMTEQEVADEIERFAKSRGSSGMSFDTIVASGNRSALPHGVASNKRIEDGDVVTIDMGCYYQGYTSDMTRTFAIGSISDQMKEVYQIVLEAHQAVSAAARPGMTGFELDKVARDYIVQAGYGDKFGHGTGHGIGLDIHEGPTISRNNHEPLQEGMVITNEPGIYLEGIGGVRIEDDLVLEADGARSLNRTSKDLLII